MIARRGRLCAGPAFALRRPQFARLRHLRKTQRLIEIHWGKPLSFVISPEGDVQKFSTIEQARYWLRKKWPVCDAAQKRALDRLEAAMDCMASVGTARRAFIRAARTAGFIPETQVLQAARPVAA